MKIKEIVSQSRRDIKIDIECEHCGAIEKNVSGYDDTYFHSKVVPDMVCEKCGKKAKDNFRPLAPKYKESEVL